MSDLTTWGLYPVPTTAEAATVPADMLELATALDAHTVLFATSVSDRDAKYSGIDAGALVTCATDSTVWLSLGSSTWLTLHSDTGWLTTGFTWAADFANSASRWRKIGSQVWLEVSATYSGATVTASGSGNLTPDVDVVTFSGDAPTISRNLEITTSATLGHATFTTGGVLYITTLTASTSLTSGNVVRFNVNYLAD